MEVSVENTGPLGRRLKVSLPDANLNDKVTSRLNKLSKEVQLKGFRPGAIPQQVMRRRFGKSVHAEILNEVIQDSFSEALKTHELQPTAMPKIDDIKEDNGTQLEFTATFEVFPEIKLTDFSEFEVEQSMAEISDEDVTKMIEKMQNQMGHWHAVERAAQKGDKLMLALTYTVEGKDPVEHDDFEVTLEDKTLLADLLKGLEGKKVEEAFDVTTQYPEDWPEKTMASKSVTFAGKVKAIEERHALSIEKVYERFNLSGDDLPKQLNDKIRSELENQAADIKKNLVKEAVLEQLSERNTLEVPSSLVEQEKQAMLKEQQSQQAPAPTSEEEQAEFNKSAERRVELGLLINEVVSHFDIKVDGKRVRAEIEKQAAQFGQSEEIIKLYYKNERLLQQVERQVLLDQAAEAILKEAKVVDKPMSFDELMKLADQN